MSEESRQDATGGGGSSALSKYSHAWRALRHRNFRLFITGQSISVIGTWMTRVAMAWLVYRLTHSPWMLGAIGFANQVPSFLLAPVAGVIIDRVDRRKLLLGTQALLMTHSLLLAALTLTHTITVPMLFVLAVWQGLVNTLDFPTRQSFTAHMVGGREDIQNAIAIISSMMNTARLVGPSLGGLLIAATSEGWCFLVDGLSFIAVITSIAMMTPSPVEAPRQRPGVVAELKEGWKYVTGSLPIRSILTLFFPICLLGWPFTVLMPVFAAQVLHGGPHTLGFLMGAIGVGAGISAVNIALRKSVRGLVGQLPWAALLFGTSLICFGFSHWVWLSLVLLLGAGFGLMRGNNGTNIVMQTLIDDEMRGRVMSYYTFSVEGLAPWGSLTLGALASWIGVQHTVMVSGTVVILGALWFRMRLGRIREAIRPIYVRLGIRPEDAVAEAELVDEGLGGV